MAGKDPQDNSDKLRQRIAALQAKLKKQDAATRERERKQDNRRCIIAGRYMLKHAKLNPNDAITKKLISLLDEYLVPDRTHTLAMINADRALYAEFGIELLPPDTPANAGDQTTEGSPLKNEFQN